VQAPLLNRIVQRAVLNVLQDEASLPNLQRYFRTPTSFGGVLKRGLSDALAAAHAAIKDGQRYFIRSDIRGFFTKIPKPLVLETIFAEVPDPLLRDLIRRSVEVELENMEALGEDRQLFPLEDQGVPQGCCLSPLLGNIFLRDFDAQMNGRGIVCLRYIDDFLIVGPTAAKTRAAFENARGWLSEYQMDAYDPECNADKAESGRGEDGLTFLGCDVRIDKVSPGRQARKRLLERTQKLLTSSTTELGDPAALKRKHRDLAATLADLNHILTAWGNQYAHCNDWNALAQLDRAVDVQLRTYLGRTRGALERALRSTDQLSYRRVLGVQPLRDSKSKPIICD